MVEQRRPSDHRITRTGQQKGGLLEQKSSSGKIGSSAECYPGYPFKISCLSTVGTPAHRRGCLVLTTLCTIAVWVSWMASLCSWPRSALLHHCHRQQHLFSACFTRASGAPVRACFPSSAKCLPLFPDRYRAHPSCWMHPSLGAVCNQGSA